MGGDAGRAVNVDDIFASGMRALLGAVEQGKAAMEEAFKDPNAPPVMSDLAKKFPPGLAQYVNNVVMAAGMWEDRLKKRFGVEIRYEIDWDGFTGQPERNELALINLKEMGVDWMYYALTGLADKLPAEFGTKVRNRVRVLKIVRVATAAEKSLTAQGQALVLTAELHNDYSGYLTMQEMAGLMPGLVEQMAEVPREELHAFWTGEAEEKNEEPVIDPKVEALESARKDAAGTLANCGPQLEGVFGSGVKMEMDWEGILDAEGVWGALNASLSPVLAGVMVAAQDEGVKQELRKRVKGILLKAVAAGGQGFWIQGKRLVYQAAGAVPLDAMKAAEMLKGILLGKEKKAVVKKKAPAATKKAAVKAKGKKEGRVAKVKTKGRAVKKITAGKKLKPSPKAKARAKTRAPVNVQRKSA